MKTCICILLSVLLMLTMIGCSDGTGNEPESSADIYREKATEYVNSGDLEAAIAALEEGVAQTNDESLKQYLEDLKSQQATTAPTEDNTSDVPGDTVEPIDISKYAGEWAESGFSWTSGGFHMNIEVNESKISITCSKVLSSRLADTSILANTSMINGNELTSGFSDSWGNKGILNVRFEDQQIVCTVSDVEQDANALASISEGEYILQAYEEVAQTPSVTVGAYDSIVGSYVDAYGPGEYYVHIGYKDSTKQEAMIAVDMFGYYFEMPLNGDVNSTMTGAYLSGGSEPKCGVDFSVVNGNWLDAEIYIAEMGTSQGMAMMPTSEMPVPAESENPFYVG